MVFVKGYFMCTNPLKGFVNSSGKIVCVRKSDVVAVWPDDSKESGWSFARGFESPIPSNAFTKYVDLPCRSCLDCFRQQRREWISRAVAEAQYHDKMIFLTLTYDDDNIPVAQSVDEETGEIFNHHTLRYSDFQRFMKRLRKHVQKPLRFMVCGEYGSRTFRPHYHAIIYGVSVSDFDGVKVHSLSDRGDVLYECDELKGIWKHGFVTVSDSNISTIAYVAGYVVKKLSSSNDKWLFDSFGLVRPFIRASNRPGLGRRFFDEHLDDFQDIYDYKSVYTPDGPFQLRLTSNWKRRYELEKGLRFVDDYGIMRIDEDYEKRMIQHRQDFIDHSFDLLDTDMSKEDFNYSKNLNFRNSSNRKRGKI